MKMFESYEILSSDASYNGEPNFSVAYLVYSYPRSTRFLMKTSDLSATTFYGEATSINSLYNNDTKVKGFRMGLYISNSDEDDVLLKVCVTPPF